ncbi:unnamed protein product [Mytilus coruscus]|uniref:Apple domain-containing protein n=1 Tax=Mytilus coruscus TaxID=42192 RepID=A0A6J8CQH3_MYTCO|nr:unnamed protein product [Mytilus coruscus]
MSDQVSINSINECIHDIECSDGLQKDVDDLYNNFVDIMHNEMNNKLESRVKVLNGTNNKRRRFKKPWWNNKLTEKWNNVCEAEKNFLNSPHTCNTTKKEMRRIFIEKRKNFDKSVQQSKRQYWHRGQEELAKLSDIDSKQFWQKIGKIGIGNERQSNIPNEVVQDDGSITDNLDIVLDKWKNCFHNLPNQNVLLNIDNNCNKIENFEIRENIICNQLDEEISINEVFKVVMKAKNCKSPGIDLIQAELSIDPNTYTYPSFSRPNCHNGVFFNISGIRATTADVLSFEADSTMMCAMMCVENNECKGFTINKKTHKCNLLSQLNNHETTRNESWDIFILCSK